MRAIPIPLPVDAAAGFRSEDFPESAWPRQELIDGSLLMSPAPGQEHQHIVGELFLALRSAIPEDLKVLPGVGVFERSETDRLLIPDVVVFDKAAWDRKRVTLHPQDAYLAVEVMSSCSHMMDRSTKRNLYLEWGIPLYWALDPRTQKIHEYGSTDSAQTWLADVHLSSIWPERD